MEKPRFSSPEHARRRLMVYLSVALLGLAFLTGCTTPTPSAADQAMHATNQAYVRTVSVIQTEDKATFRAKYPIHTVTPSPYTHRADPFSSRLICGYVDDGGSAYQALSQGNNGTVPNPKDESGYPLYVVVDHKVAGTGNNTRSNKIRLDNLANSNVIVAAHDRVCASSDTAKLDQVPTPTPGPYSTQRP